MHAYIQSSFYIHPSIYHSSIHPPVCGCMHTANHPSISTHPSTTHKSIHLCIHLSLHPSIHLASHLFIHPPIHPCVHVCTHHTTHLCMYLSIYPSTPAHFPSSICIFIHLNTHTHRGRDCPKRSQPIKKPCLAWRRKPGLWPTFLVDG